MAVRIHISGHSPKHNRRRGYNKMVRAIAPTLVALQGKGYVSAAQIAEALGSTTIRTSKGKPYAESTIFGILKRGRELGLPLVIRTRSEAASAWIRKPRPPKHQPKTPA